MKQLLSKFAFVYRVLLERTEILVLLDPLVLLCVSHLDQLCISSRRECCNLFDFAFASSCLGTFRREGRARTCWTSWIPGMS